MIGQFGECQIELPVCKAGIHHVHPHRTGQGKIGACGAVGIAGESRGANKEESPGGNIVGQRGDFSVLDRLGSQADDNGIFGRTIGIG